MLKFNPGESQCAMIALCELLSFTTRDVTQIWSKQLCAFWLDNQSIICILTSRTSPYLVMAENHAIMLQKIFPPTLFGVLHVTLSPVYCLRVFHVKATAKACWKVNKFMFFWREWNKKGEHRRIITRICWLCWTVLCYSLGLQNMLLSRISFKKQKLIAFCILMYRWWCGRNYRQ